MSNNIKTFYLMWARGSYIYYSLAILLWIVIVLYWLPVYAVIFGLLYQVLMIEIYGLKIEVYEDKLIICKIFNKEKIILFNSIENVIKGQRVFYGEILAYRDALIIPYVEPSGYKCEFSDLYNEEIYICINSYFSVYKNLKKEKNPKILLK